MARAAIDDPKPQPVPAAERPLRVAMVTETYPPEVNGVAMSVQRVVQGLRERRHEVQLVRPRQHGDRDAGRRPGLDEVLTAGWPIPMYPGLRMGAPSRRTLLRLWSQRRPDVVHVATEGPLGWSALAAAHRLGLPVTSDFRTNFQAYGRHYRIGWLSRPILGCLRRFHNRTRCTMVPTEAMRSLLAGCGFERLVVVSRGVDTEHFRPQRRSDTLRARWGARPDDLVLLSVGRLAAEKSLHLAVDAYEALARVRPGARLVFVGDGPQRAELQARCPRAVFAGPRHGEDLAAHYASADLFLFPSQTETFGNVTLEAMASGLPVVAFDSGAAGQLIDSGANGLLAAGCDGVDFVRAVLEAGSDTSRRLRWGVAARAAVLPLDWSGIVGHFERVLLRSVGGPASAVSAPAGMPARAAG